MFEKLKALEDKFNEINEKLMQPETVNNTSLYTSLMKEYKTLTPIVEKFGEYKKAKAANDEAIELLDAGGMDKDFKEMVQMQLEESKEDMAKLEEELKLLLSFLFHIIHLLYIINCENSYDSASLIIVFTFFSALLRTIMNSRPQPSQRSLKSMPERRTIILLLPQG